MNEFSRLNPNTYSFDPIELMKAKLEAFGCMNKHEHPCLHLERTKTHLLCRAYGNRIDLLLMWRCPILAVSDMMKQDREEENRREQK